MTRSSALSAVESSGVELSQQLALGDGIAHRDFDGADAAAHFEAQLGLRGGHDGARGVDRLDEIASGDRGQAGVGQVVCRELLAEA